MNREYIQHHLDALCGTPTSRIRIEEALANIYGVLSVRVRWFCNTDSRQPMYEAHADIPSLCISLRLLWLPCRDISNNPCDAYICSIDYTVV